MLKTNLAISLIIAILIFASESFAHVQLDFPLGGETFVAGETINIEWHSIIEHDQKDWDLYFSSDGGNSWEAIQLDIEVSQLNYYWTVPVIATESGRVQIIQDNNGANYIDGSGDFIIQTASSLVDEQDGHPKSFALNDNYPNPFNPTTVINYQLPITKYVDLSIYNSLGQKVAILVLERQEAGNHQVEWDATGFASGVYYYRIEAGEFVDVKKMVLFK